MTAPSDDDFTRAALEEAVSGVDPTDRLTAIRARTRRRTRRSWYAAGTAALAAAAVVVAVAVVSSGDEPSADKGPAGPSTTPSTTPSETTLATDTVTPDSEPPAIDPAARPTPVFYVGDTPEGPALFREIRQLVPGVDTDELVSLATTSSASDPDYRSLWPVEIDHVGFDGIGDDGAFSVVITPDLVDRPEGMTGREAVLAIQQLVFTLQGGGDTAAPVAFYLDRPAGEAPSVLGVPMPPGGFTRDPDVLAQVNVLAPAEGQTVSGSFTARGLANSFEATVPWQILDADGVEVDTYSAMASGAYDRLYPWETEIDVSSLPPGTYTFVAMTDDPTGGEGPGATSDTRTIIVADD